MGLRGFIYDMIFVVLECSLRHLRHLAIDQLAIST